MDRFEIAVVGAHMLGMPLNPELVGLGGGFVRCVQTTRDYRFYALAGGPPRRPGLLRVADDGGETIEAEIWSLGAEGFGKYVATVPPPLSIGTLRLADGTAAKGFLVEAAGIAGARDITHLGGWRAYVEELATSG